MLSKTVKLKLLCLVFFIGLAIFGFTIDNSFVSKTKAFSSGPPLSVTGAPGEFSCTQCHSSGTQTGKFSIEAPQNYIPGETYQIIVRHTSSDNTRQRWGFQLTSLNSANNSAGTFSILNTNTQTASGNGRNYVQQTSLGAFQGQTGGAEWAFNWTAPPTDVGPVTFYAAGNQANNNGHPDGDQIYSTNTVAQPEPKQSNPPTLFDFDGDNKTDISIFRPSLGEWWYLRSSDLGNRALQFGQSTDVPTPADFTGDGKTDISFFRNGEWFVLRSEDDSFFSFPWGQAGDIPAPGDFDGDGNADPTIFRPADTTWFILKSTGGVDIIPFGIAEDKPVIADYDGDGKDDIAVYRPSVSEWWINRSQDGVAALQFGSAGDRTTQGDYTRDGKADVSFFRPTTGEWFIIRSEDSSFFSFPFGTTNDIPAPGDYDGDGVMDTAVFRPSNTTWFLNTTTSGVQITSFGLSSDTPLPSVYSRH